MVSSVPRVHLCCVCPLWARQFADAFNQPLSFDTSSVTDTSHMFEVRLRLRLLPTMDLPCTLGHAMLLALETRRTSPHLLLVRVVSVRREQTAHLVRMGGHFGLRLR
jgi:hypothetical protein